MTACAVCEVADSAVAVLSTGFPVHPGCWPEVRTRHTDRFFGTADPGPGNTDRFFGTADPGPGKWRGGR